jgi:AbrB family looped-hinge helix DNA binding protein
VKEKGLREMVARTTKVTRKGQVTILVDIRRRLGIKQGDMLAVEEHDDEIVFKRDTGFAESTAGIFAKYRLPKAQTPEEEREIFGQLVADEVAEQLKNE